MKENRIDILIELLNEYEIKTSKEENVIPVYWTNRLLILQYWSYTQQLSISYMISKHYGFIQRLVENDKIDLMKITTCAVDTSDEWSEREVKSDSDSLLMLLSISDTPIDDLISYLK